MPKLRELLAAGKTGLTPRERVLTTLEHGEPDRVPIDLSGTVVSGIHILAYKNLAKAMALPSEEGITDIVQQLAGPSEIVLRQFNSDFRPVYMRPPRSWKFCEYTPGCGRPYFVDEWGIKWGRNPYYYDMIEHPLKNAVIQDLDAYAWLNPHAADRIEGLERDVKKLHKSTDFAIVAGMSGPVVTGGLFEQAWWLRGFERFLMDLIIRPEFANALLDRILDLQIELYDEYLSIVGEYVQVVEWGDDYGMQTAPLLSPTLFRKYFKPRDKRFLDFIKSKTDAKIFFHCFGSVYPLIEDLIEAGVDILNPIQPLAANMDHAKLKREFGKRLCFHGGLDTQQLLPFGTTREVKEGVRKLLSNMAPSGGYIFATANNIQADVPPGNIQAMFEAAKEYGSYPLKA